MTPANRTKLDDCGRRLIELSQARWDAQTVTLRILDVLEVLKVVLTDLVFRPEVNSK